MSALLLHLLLPFLVACARDDSWSMSGRLYACCESPLSPRCLRAQAHLRLCPAVNGLDYGEAVVRLYLAFRPWQPLVIRSSGPPRPMCEGD